MNSIKILTRMLSSTLLQSTRFSNPASVMIKLPNPKLTGKHYIFEKKSTPRTLISQRHFTQDKTGKGNRISNECKTEEADEQNKAEEYYDLYYKMFSQNNDTNETQTSPNHGYYEKYLNLNKQAELTLKNKQSSDKLTHTNHSGEINMVDVGYKADTHRVAIAHAKVHLTQEAIQLVHDNKIGKGEVISTAKIAGIMAAKKTSSLIPLCHPLSVNKVEITVDLCMVERCVEIECEAHTVGKTGVEMEALTGATVAALTIYDMCKSVTHDIVISDVQLLHKRGGVRGEVNRNKLQSHP